MIQYNPSTSGRSFRTRKNTRRILEYFANAVIFFGVRAPPLQLLWPTTGKRDARLLSTDKLRTQIGSSTLTITGPQCRAARALVEWTVEEVAERSSVSPGVIADFERKISDPSADVKRRLLDVLESGGAVFIWENGGGVDASAHYDKIQKPSFTVSESRLMAEMWVRSWLRAIRYLLRYQNSRRSG